MVLFLYQIRIQRLKIRKNNLVSIPAQDTFFLRTCVIFFISLQKEKEKKNEKKMNRAKSSAEKNAIVHQCNCGANF